MDFLTGLFFSPLIIPVKIFFILKYITKEVLEEDDKKENNPSPTKTSLEKFDEEN